MRMHREILHTIGMLAFAVGFFYRFLFVPVLDIDHLLILVGISVLLLDHIDVDGDGGASR